MPLGLFSGRAYSRNEIYDLKMSEFIFGRDAASEKVSRCVVKKSPLHNIKQNTFFRNKKKVTGRSVSILSLTT